MHVHICTHHFGWSLRNMYDMLCVMQEQNKCMNINLCAIFLYHGVCGVGGGVITDKAMSV
jgi:hypothetical protein